MGYEKINPLLYDPYIEDISCDGVEIPLTFIIQGISILESNIFEEEELDAL